MHDSVNLCAQENIWAQDVGANRKLITRGFSSNTIRITKSRKEGL